MIKTFARRKLGVRPAHRKMMLRSLATHLIHYEKITTTEARGKELKAYADKMIHRLKNLTPLRREREALRWLAPNGLAVESKLTKTILSRYQDRSGGCVRLFHLEPRSSDRARLARVELA